MTETGRSSFIAPPLRRSAEPARTDEAERDDAPRGDAQLRIPDVDDYRLERGSASHLEHETGMAEGR